MPRHTPANIERLAEQVEAAAKAANDNADEQARLASFIDSPAISPEVKSQFMARLQLRREEHRKLHARHSQLEDELHHKMHKNGMLRRLHEEYRSAQHATRTKATLPHGVVFNSQAPPTPAAVTECLKGKGLPRFNAEKQQKEPKKAVL